MPTRQKTRENLLAAVVSVVILTLTVPGAGYGAESQYNLAISPQNPSPSDIVEITLSGEWYDACVPNRSSISVVGHDIYFDAILDYYWPDIVCAMVISGWTLTENVGPLSPGTYTVYASIPGYSPYTQVGTFDVTEQGNGNNTTAGPVAHWKFDEGSGGIAYDSVGSNHGSISGAQWTTGVIGGALEFDGVNDYVALQNNAVTTTEFTVAGWANQFGLGGGAESSNLIFCQNDDPGADNHSAVMLYADKYDNALAIIRGHIDPRQILSSPRRSYNEWHHYVMTVDSNDFIFYIDGIEVDRAANNQVGNYVTSIDNIYIGRIHSNGEDKGFFNGSIDDVRIYDRALSAQEIEELYGQDIPVGLVAHWTFDEGEGDTAYDSAGTNYGTLVNGPQWTSGQINGALEFDGVDDYVALPDNEPVWLPQNNFAFSLWVYFFNDVPILENLLDMDGAGSGSSSNRLGYGIFRQEEGKCHFSMVSGDGYSDILLSNTVLLKEKWYHLVALRNGTTQSIYINGRLDSSKNCSSDPIDFDGNYNDDKVNIGRASRSGDITGSYINGLIDDVRIYDRALSAGEIEELWGGEIPTGDVYHVDSINGNDTNNGLTPKTAFATIQKGIDLADHNDAVLVYLGTYQEGINFLGKAITVQGVATAAGIPVIENPDDFAVSFYNGESPDSTLRNFVIRDSFIGVFIAGSSPTLSNLTVVGNKYGIEAYADAEPDITNSIFRDNTESDLFQCQAMYSWADSTPKCN